MLASNCMALGTAKHEQVAIFRQKNERIANVFRALSASGARLAPTGAERRFAGTKHGEIRGIIPFDPDTIIQQQCL